MTEVVARNLSDRVRRWGATEAEACRGYPCDDLVPGPVLPLTRAVDVAAPAALLYRWLCQVALAPYSYDLLDNAGRRSPQQLVEGTDRLVVGQRMVIFALVSFEPGRQWTGIVRGGPERIFGPVAITYLAEPIDDGHSRLICRMVVGRYDGMLRRARADALAAGDLVMMRRQLLNLRGLAERDALAGVPGHVPH